MKEATFKDALRIADILDFDVDAVWDIIKGRKYNDPADLELHVCQVHAQMAPEELGF
jgi:RNAse (barnase) inhibitor barstar